MKEKCKVTWLNRNQYGLLASCLTIVALIAIYTLSSRLIGGQFTFCHSDMMVQYVSFAKLFWRNLMSGGALDYTFQVTLGTPSIPLYTYYCLSPFNIFFFLIEDITTAGACVVFGKLALAAYTFWHFQKKILKSDGIPSVWFALCYALCSYSVTYYYNIHTLDGVYMLPLIIELLYILVKEGKYKRLILAYTYLFVVSFYAAYMIGIFSFVIFLLFMITIYGKQWKRYVTTALRFGLTVLVAAMQSAVFLFPTAYSIFANVSKEGAGFQGLKLGLLDIYNNIFLGEMQTGEGNFPLLYCGLLTVILLPAFFVNKKIKPSKKIIAAVVLAFLLVCSLWNPAYLFIHGCAAPNGSGFRFAYFYSFALLCCAVLEWNTKKTYQLVKMIPWVVLNLGIYYLVYVLQAKRLAPTEQASSILGLELNGVFLGLTLIMITLGIKKLPKSRIAELILCGIIMIELIMNGYFCVSRLGASLEEKRQISTAFDEISESAIEEIKAADSGIYRIYFANADEHNDAARNDYMALDYFTSLENRQLRQALMHLGYYTTPRYVIDCGGTEFTRMIFAQKYQINVNNSAYIVDPSIGKWSQNPMSLSLGFMVSDQMENLPMDPFNPFENQNAVMSAMTGKEVTAYLPYSDEIICTTENMQLGTYNEYCWVEKSDASIPDASILLQVPDAYGLPMNVYFAQEESVQDDTTPLVLPESGYQELLSGVSYLSATHIIELQKNEEDLYGVKIEMTQNTNSQGAFKDVLFYAYDREVLEAVFDELQGNQMQIESMKNNCIVASVIATDDKPLLFTSIPYDKDWKVMVDGIETTTITVLDQAFLAVLLPPGEHEITFQYQSSLVRNGAWISVFGIILFITCFFIDYRSNHGKKAAENERKVNEEHQEKHEEISL